MEARSCVLAYSGGLDTSAIVLWLREQGLDVHCVLVDVGQNEDLMPLCEKALRFGAKSAVIRDVRPAMLAGVVPYALGLAATYEQSYKLGTALARPYIAQAQVERAREVGATVLAHGATGKGNDQIRFEYAYRSLAPDCEILAPWKVWDFQGRADLIAYLRAHGVTDDFVVEKDYSLDENLWHLSVEGGDLEDPAADLQVETILAAVSDRFAQPRASQPTAKLDRLTIEYQNGIPVALDGTAMPLAAILDQLNRSYRHAPWAWDLIIENRMTGIKSRGIYINPAARLLYDGVDALARSCFQKPLYDAWADLGSRYADALYAGEYFTDQRVMLEAAAAPLVSRLNGTVTLALGPALHAVTIQAEDAIFRPELSTFEASEFTHADAAGFIHLSWLNSVGRPFQEKTHEDALEESGNPAPDVRADQRLAGGGLVSTAP